MVSIIKSHIVVFSLLVALTFISFWSTEDSSLVQYRDGALIMVGILALALIKVRLVIMHFMEVKHAPIALRILFEVWLIVVYVAMCGVYYFPPQ